jgi:hypothetical protein
MVALLYWWYRHRVRRAREIPGGAYVSVPRSHELSHESCPNTLSRSTSRAEERSPAIRPIGGDHAMPPSFWRARLPFRKDIRQGNPEWPLLAERSCDFRDAA